VRSHLARRSVNPMKPLNDIGSLQWTRHSNGLLTTRRERVKVVVQGVRFVLDRAPHKLSTALGRPQRRPPAEFDLDDLPIPRTEAARAAEEVIEETMAPVWVYHSYRTYAWAYILGRYDGLEFDEEVLYVSSLLHDVSLADSNVAVRPRCFSLSAAEAADELVAQSGWAAERRALIGDTITRHINLWIPPRKRPEAYLLHVGTKLDVMGLRYPDLAASVVADVIGRYPRENFKSVFRPKMRAHGAAVPDSRAGFYARHFRSDRLRAGAPFSE
jgi:hypothetical protein